MTSYIVCVWLHVLAAATWIGSMVFFAAVIVPVLRHPELREKAPSLLRLAGARFRVLGWIALSLSIVTGAANLHFRGLSWSILSSADFWSQGFGRLLAWKLALVGIVLVATMFHEAIANKRAVDQLERSSDPARAERIRRNASLVGRFVMLASLVILFLAVAMVRGCG